MPTIQEEVLALTRVKPKSGESAEDFTSRVVKKVNTLADADVQNWEALSEAAQAWVNKNVSAEENDQELDLLDLELTGERISSEKENVVVKKPANGKTQSKPKLVEPAKKSEKKVVAKAGVRGRARVGSDDATIKVLQETSPYREGCKSDKAFKKYRSGMTVKEAKRAGIPYDYIVWDNRQKHIEIVPAA